MAGDDADMVDELINLLRLISSHSSMRRIFLSRVEYKFSPPSPQRKRTRWKCLHCASYPTETFRSRRENTFDSQSNCLLMCRSNVFKIDLLSGEKRFRESIKRPRPDGLIANGKMQNHFDILRATLTTSCRMIDGWALVVRDEGCGKGMKIIYMKLTHCGFSYLRLHAKEALINGRGERKLSGIYHETSICINSAPNTEKKIKCR